MVYFPVWEPCELRVGVDGGEFVGYGLAGGSFGGLRALLFAVPVVFLGFAVPWVFVWFPCFGFRVFVRGPD